MSNQEIFQDPPEVSFTPSSTDCPHGHGTMRVLKTRRKRIVLHSVGPVIVHETICICPDCQCIIRSEELATLAPYRHTFGYDVITSIGDAMFQDSFNEQQIRKQLADRGITISTSEIAVLAKKYVCYLAQAHQESNQELRTHLEGQGGYILHLDGTCEGDSPHLFVGLDEISELVLHSVKIPSERKASVLPFLEEVRARYGKPAAVVHDMGKGILSAVAAVFTGVPDFICHFHFLRDVGKDLFQSEYQRIQSRFRSHGTQGNLKEIVRQCRKSTEFSEDVELLSKQCMLPKRFDQSPHPSPEAQLYGLLQWAFAGKSIGDGYGFPFDRPYITFLQRLRILKDTILKLKLHKNCTLADKTVAVLHPLWYDQTLKNTEARLQEKALLFDELRKAMKIAEPAGRFGLNDPGSGDIRTIEAQVSQFYEQNFIDEILHIPGLKKMQKQMIKYWEKLFADPITVTIHNEEIVLVPQRTNTSMERYFRGLKRNYCLKSGTAGMNKVLRAMHSSLPFVHNLEHAEYWKLLLGSFTSLEQRFAAIDISKVHQILEFERDSKQLIEPNIKKLAKNPQLPKQFLAIYQ